MADNTKVLEIRDPNAAYNTVRDFIKNAPPACEKYSLRANSYIVKGGEEKKFVYVLFLRDGTESIFQEIYNWFYADEQRTAAKELLCNVIMNGHCSEKIDAKRERMLNRIKKMERIIPDENLKKKVLYDLSEDDKRAAQLKNIELKLDEYAEAVRDFNNEWDSSTDFQGKFPEKTSAEEIADKALQHPWREPIARILDEAGHPWNRYITKNFLRFISYAISESLAKYIDYGLVEEFCKKWLLSKTEDMSAANFAALVGLTEVQKRAVEAAVRQIDAVLNLSDEGIKRLSEEKGIIAVVGSRKTSADETSYSWISYVIQGASMLSGFKSLCTIRPVFASANPVCSLAHSSAVKRLGDKGKRTIKKIENAIPVPKAVDRKKTEVRPLEIKKAKALADISFDYQPELDISDIGTGTCILARDSVSPESTSENFGDWLRSLRPLPEVNDGKCTVVKSREEEVIIFAKYQVGPLNSCLTDNQISYLEEVYRGAIQWAVSNGKSILLTDVFYYDELTAKRCVYAMLAPVRDAIAAGERPAVHIRVASRKLYDEIKAGLESSLRLITPLDARPLVEIRQIIDETHLALPGLMMVTQETENFSSGSLQDIFSCLYREYKEAHKKGCAEKIRVRRSLSYNSITHLYFFAESFGPKKNGAPQVQKILDEYTEFFKAARARKCLYVTIELLWVAEQHQDKNNIPLLKNLCDLIKNANRDEPRLKVCIVTTNKAVAANVSEQFF